MCTQLKTCRSFVSVLEYLLAIGNYLNENAGKEKAKGIRLSSLAKVRVRLCCLTFEDFDSLINMAGSRLSSFLCSLPSDPV